ncbi:MAG: PorP/SprF family type IX secretion system membrane protein [Saprospiraceae bacterium]
MKLKHLLSLVFFLFSIGMINAQDIHFSQYDLSPMTLNPANAGAFKGTVRIGGVYRDQWGSVLQGNQFRTPSLYVDAPIIRGFRKKDWVGVAVNFVNDQSGAYNYQQTNIGAALAYHIALDPMRKNILTIGGQYSQNQRRADGTALDWGDQFNSATGAFDLPGNPANILDNVSYNDLAAGITFRSRPRAGLTWNLGASMFHILEPENSGLSTTTSVVPQKIVANAGATFDLNQNWQLTPQAFFATQAGTNEIIIQTIAGYKLGTNGFILNMGAGYRVNDAAMVLAGLEFKNLRVGIAYDLNVSPLRTYSNYQGGFEVGVAYIVRIPKNPTIPPVIFNSRF